MFKHEYEMPVYFSIQLSGIQSSNTTRKSL